MSAPNPKVTQIPVNAAGANGPGYGPNNLAPGFTAIVMTRMSSRVEVMEDPSYAPNNGVPQGLQGFYADTQPGSGFPPTGNQMTWLPQTQGQVGQGFQPIIFGGTERGRGDGGEGTYVGADSTVVLYLQSASAQPTQVLLVEYW